MSSSPAGAAKVFDKLAVYKNVNLSPNQKVQDKVKLSLPEDCLSRLISFERGDFRQGFTVLKLKTFQIRYFADDLKLFDKIFKFFAHAAILSQFWLIKKILARAASWRL